MTTMNDAAEGVPEADVLLRRAATAAAGLAEAREAHAGGTSALVAAYEDLAQAHGSLVADMATMEEEAAARDEELARLEALLATKDVEAAQLGARLESAVEEGAAHAADARKFGEMAREALAQLRASKSEGEALRAERDAISSEHRRLSLAFNELISQVNQGLQGLSDEGRRIHGIVPAAARPRPAPLRSAAPSPRAPSAALPAPAQVPAPAPVPVPAAPVAPALPDMAELESGIRKVVDLSLAGRRPSAPEPEADERLDMVQALGSFGALSRRKAG